MNTVTRQDITSGLKELALPDGACVLVHSSLSSFGYVEGGADAVIDALLETVGPAGTVLAPTLTGSEVLSPAHPPVFDPQTSPCWTGRIPETFRQRPEAVRSLHPTHSTAAVGPDAAALTADHINSLTPCDDLSPYGKLAQLDNGYILLLGVDHQSNTTIHHIEEQTGAAYHMQPQLAPARIRVNGREIVRHILLHAYGTPRHFGVMEPVFMERGIQQTGRIGQAVVRLVRARPMVQVTVQALRASPRILCRD